MRSGIWICRFLSLFFGLVGELADCGLPVRNGLVEFVVRLSSLCLLFRRELLEQGVIVETRRFCWLGGLSRGCRSLRGCSSLGWRLRLERQRGEQDKEKEERFVFHASW
jgi:hypothetical protein